MLHAGSEKGFVEGARLVFRAKKASGDYHAEMDGNRFEKWFLEQLLPNIEPGSVIVMDNASYHSVHLEKVPSSSTRKGDIQSWLRSKGIPFYADQLKAELLELVNEHKHKYAGYRIDTLAKAAGHDVLRLPPYHCELNPIELVWSQVKGYVAANNTTFKLDEVEKLLHAGIDLVSEENWRRDCAHVEKIENESWERDGEIDNNIQSLIIELGSDASTSSESSASETSAVEEML